MGHRRHFFLLTLVLFVVGTTAADSKEDGSLFDFYNDLVTDLGPFLALFGESMTKQYLSESTRFIDYFIFAMGPIGIITTLVSVIRLCGYVSLKAFIGRSQEGSAAIEAELSTSTSRDVYWAKEPDFWLNTRLISFFSWWPMIKRMCPINKTKGSSDVETAQTDNRGKATKQQKAANDRKAKKLIPASLNPPNLSLNVGIIQPSPWVTYSVAVLGLLLQGTIVSLAGADVWALGWNFDGTSGPSEDAPFLYVIETIVMCCGLMACAALIGETTRETRYNHMPNSLSRLIWLQPKQMIGDQSFDPFSFFESKEKAVKVWTCSWKVEDEKNSKNPSEARQSRVSALGQLLPGSRFEFLSFVSTAAVLFGYMLQFTGLRRMKPWVSLAQLVVTILMSVCRGALRMQRLSKEDNKLRNDRDLVVGYELDWLSFEIYRRYKDSLGPTKESKDETEAGVFTQVIKLWQTFIGKKPRETGSENCPSNHETLTNPKSFPQVFAIRQRLAHLTGNFSESEKMDKDEFQSWDDDYVKVRNTAKRLSEAICAVAESFVDPGQPLEDIKLQFDNLIRVKSQRNSIKLLINKPAGLTTQWTTDPARLEAILGLSMWTMLSDQRFGKPFEHETELSEESMESERIFTLSGGGSDIEMKLWFGPHTPRATEICLKTPTNSIYGLFDLWESHPADGKHGECLRIKQPKTQISKNEGTPKEAIRLFGWAAASKHLENTMTGIAMTEDTEALADDSRPFPTEDKHAKLFTTRNSILVNCAQELFVALLLGFRSAMQKSHPRNSLMTDKAEIIFDEPYFRLNSPAVKKLVQVFVDAGLGSYSDALLCILPALRSQLPTSEFGLQCSEALAKARVGEDNGKLGSMFAPTSLLFRTYSWSYKPPRLDADSISPFLGILCYALKMSKIRRLGSLGKEICVQIEEMSEHRAFAFSAFLEIGDMLRDFQVFMQVYQNDSFLILEPEPNTASDLTPRLGEAELLDKVYEDLLQARQREAVSALAEICSRRRHSEVRSAFPTIFHTCIALAASKNLAGVLAILLSFEDDLEVDDGSAIRDESLISCLRSGHEICARLLMNFGAKVNLREYGLNLRPAMANNTTTVRLLLDIHEIQSHDYQKVIKVAADHYVGERSRESIQMLVEEGIEFIDVASLLDDITSDEGKRGCIDILVAHRDRFARHGQNLPDLKRYQISDEGSVNIVSSDQ
ncbi:hypothetical protein CcaCcLH18_03986 [Colletotrichum camelliae]|nr:hypothetical protein CcaCcLH18_03986 [Colletotrichum camelliae]